MHLEKEEGRILFGGGIFFGFNLYPQVPSAVTLSCATFLSAPVLWCPVTRTDKTCEVLHKALLALMPLSARKYLQHSDLKCLWIQAGRVHFR